MPRHDWATCTDPEWMLWKLPGGTGREERLLAVAFCRRMGHLMTEDRCRRLLAEAERLFVFRGEPAPVGPDFLLGLVASVERHAEGTPCVEDLLPAAELIERLAAETVDFYYACYSESWGLFDHDLIATCEAAAAVSHASRPAVVLTNVATHAARAVYRAGGGAEQKQSDPREMASQCDLIRCVFRSSAGRTVVIEPGWLSPTVVALSRQMYESRDFSAMPILADALQDAGCDNEDVLEHCRQPGEHVRGCWVVDLVLGKC